MPFACKGICSRHTKTPLSIFYCSCCEEFIKESGTKITLGIRRCLCCNNKVRNKPYNYGKRRPEELKIE